MLTWRVICWSLWSTSSTDGDDHCVALDLCEDALHLIGWCNEHVGYDHGKSGDAGYGRENGHVRNDGVLFPSDEQMCNSH